MNARLQHRASSSRVSQTRRKAPSGNNSAFDQVRQMVDGYFAKATDARKNLLEQPYTPKQLHAWRVGLRRITATINKVTDLSDDRLEDVQAYLRACREATGRCRDIDILALETLPAFLRECEVIPPPAATMQQSILVLQEQAHTQAVESLKKDSLIMSMQSWQHWVATFDPPGNERLRKNAAEIIDERFQIVRKRIGKLDGGKKRLHRLRAAVKKLRYSMELYQHMFPKRAVTHWLDYLADLQSHFGLAHDRMMARELVVALPIADSDQAPVKALRKWAKKSAYQASQKAAQSLTKMDKLDHYWHA
jgi:CHAD domain-containing protein